MIQGMTGGSNTSNTLVSWHLNKLWNCLKANFSKYKFSTTTKFNSSQHLNPTTTISIITHTQAKLWDYQQQSTTTTTYNHVFNHNSTTSCHNSSIEPNSSIIHIYASWTCKFIINHSIINKLTYPNISLTLEHEFQQVGSW